MVETIFDGLREVQLMMESFLFLSIPDDVASLLCNCSGGFSGVEAGSLRAEVFEAKNFMFIDSRLTDMPI